MSSCRAMPTPSAAVAADSIEIDAMIALLGALLALTNLKHCIACPHEMAPSSPGPLLASMQPFFRADGAHHWAAAVSIAPCRLDTVDTTSTGTQRPHAALEGCEQSTSIVDRTPFLATPCCHPPRHHLAVYGDPPSSRLSAPTQQHVEESNAFLRATAIYAETTSVRETLSSRQALLQ